MAKWPQTTKMGLSLEQWFITGAIFFLKEFWCVRTRRNFYIEISGPVEYSTSPHFGVPQVKIAKKSIFFWNFLKFDLNAFRYRFRVQNNSKTPQEPISGHISSFRPISADISKIEFLTKIAIFAIFTYFWFFIIWPTIWPEMLKNAIRGQKWSLWTLKTCLNTLDDL